MRTLIDGYPVILESSGTSWGAYSLALPGLAVVGETREEAISLFRDGIQFHLEGLH